MELGEVWSQVHAQMAETTPLLPSMRLNQQITSRSFWKKLQVTPKMLSETKRTTRVISRWTPAGPARYS
ncbi:hypothetical protein Hanom_Chr07g00632911 [Helianthus anomalus]